MNIMKQFLEAYRTNADFKVIVHTVLYFAVMFGLVILSAHWLLWISGK